MKIKIIFLLVILIAIAGCSSNSVDTSVSVDLKDSTIFDGESTQLIISIKNTGEEHFEGMFKITADDPSSIKIEELPADKKKFSLGPEEEVTRLVKITGETKSLRTDYQINVDVQYENGTEVSESSTVLSVRKD